MTKSRRLEMAGYEARLAARHRRRWKDNMKMYHEEVVRV
jgi:hypothetical protein